MTSPHLLAIENRTQRLAYRLTRYGAFEKEDVLQKLDDFVFYEVLLNGFSVSDYFYLKSQNERIYNEVVN